LAWHFVVTQLKQKVDETYAAALEAYLIYASEEVLLRAYDFGRKALADGLGVLDMTMLHHEALGAIASSGPKNETERFERAAEFLAEALSPFEMALRGWHDTAARLRQANDELEARVAQRTAAYREAQEHLDRAQQIASIGSWEWNLRTGEQIWSKQLYRICGLTEGAALPAGHSVVDFIDVADRERHNEWFAQVAARRDPGPIEYRIRRLDGEQRIVRAEGEALTEGSTRKVSVTLQDITEQKAADNQLHELQAELAHVSRLSAMGQMAAMIVHELTQPLTAISNYMMGARTILERDNPSLASLGTALERSEDQASRAAQIIRRLRGFASQGESAPKPEAIAPLVDEAVELLRVGTRTEGVLIAIPEEPPDIMVLADKIQIQQVLLNLMRNAVEAVAHQARKEITLRFTVRGDVVQISVADNGPGLPDEVRAKLFEPFVSTKRTGMGIGLSICQKIVMAHNGRLWPETNPTGGTIFHLILPIASAERVPL
jgi:two-component system, LuxR family, sensor kinase FixL